MGKIPSNHSNSAFTSLFVALRVIAMPLRIPPANTIFMICFVFMRGVFLRLFCTAILKRFDDFAPEKHEENGDRNNAKHGAGH